MTTEIVIHTVKKATWTRYEKWRVELELIDHKSRVCWLTAAQYDFLESAFDHTNNGYSDGKIQVIGTFGDDNYYIRCKAIRVPPKRRHFTPLVDENTEAACDLLDND